ncbi:DUF3995 domain-containing protein [Streptomyces actuosus]|uniref:DUF3995 domain-containing protein n=1 Tax=Streptomyces actuosus TaxID=1885 RepID=A0ABS2VNN1_STRAS|nr:DUF3995 domain-containing protein [Streptomyces actuosus]MBN0044661.1 DUF3995 domain-containing protein [Streptomyces actuosus]
MRRVPEGTGGAPSRLWARAACLWAVAFAGLHFYWAVGGDLGLSVSAGPQATERSLWFVVVGLWGVGALCLLGALLAWLLPRSGLRGVPALLVRRLGWGVSALLLARGIGVEVLLLTDATHLSTSVSAGQRVWTLALWNPWFVAGGLAFGLAALRSGRCADAEPPPAHGARSLRRRPAAPSLRPRQLAHRLTERQVNVPAGRAKTC